MLLKDSKLLETNIVIDLISKLEWEFILNDDLIQHLTFISTIFEAIFESLPQAIL